MKTNECNTAQNAFRNMHLRNPHAVCKGQLSQIRGMSTWKIGISTKKEVNKCKF